MEFRINVGRTQNKNLISRFNFQVSSTSILESAAMAKAKKVLERRRTSCRRQTELRRKPLPEPSETDQVRYFYNFFSESDFKFFKTRFANEFPLKVALLTERTLT